jgi:hypothetical protein
MLPFRHSILAELFKGSRRERRRLVSDAVVQTLAVTIESSSFTRPWNWAGQGAVWSSKPTEPIPSLELDLSFVNRRGPEKR